MRLLHPISAVMVLFCLDLAQPGSQTLSGIVPGQDVGKVIAPAVNGLPERI
jgi:hypothetical protein